MRQWERAKRMVYCRLVSVENDYIIYLLGSVVSDITGLLKLYPKKHYYEIERQAQKKPVYIHAIDRMLFRYQEKFDRGEIPDKMSYEI